MFQGDIALDPRIKHQMNGNIRGNKVSRELITGTDNRWPKVGDKVHVPYVIEGIGTNTFTHCNLSIHLMIFEKYEVDIV